MLKATRLRLAVALASAAVMLTLGLHLFARPAPATSSPVASTAPRPLTARLDGSTGTRYVYALEWRTHQSTRLPLPGQAAGQGEPMKGSLRLSGDLVLRTLGRDGEAWLVGASLENLREPELHIASRNALPDPSVLSGREALVEVEPTGAIRTMRFASKDPDVFKHVMQWLLTHTQVVLPEDEARRSAGRWNALEDTSLGQVQASYAVDETRDLTVHRVRTAYTRLYAATSSKGAAPHQLDSRATFTFDAAGYLSGLSHQERLLARSGTGEVLLDSTELLRLTLHAVERFTPPAQVALADHAEVRRPGVITISDATRRRAQEQRAAGLPMERLMADLLKYGGSGEMPDHNDWLWKAVGRLQLEPERCRELVAVFTSPTLKAPGRALVLDLLVGAGHAQAQAVLRELLETREAREEGKAYLSFVQRLGLLAAPEQDTLEWLARHHARARSEKQEGLRNANAYALGAAVSRLGAEDAKAGSYTRLLLDGLGEARTPAERETYLRALGNAGRTEGVAAVLSHVADPEVSVRMAVAAALRKTETPRATGALLQLARAPERQVQTEALISLKEHHLDAQALAQLRDMVLSGGLRAGSERSLISLLAERLDGGPAVVQMLQSLSRMESRDPALRGYVLQLMARAARQGRRAP
jgi:hypothetical protein